MSNLPSVLRNVNAIYIWAQAAAILATLLMTYLACHPILAFTRRGWTIKREDILSSMNTNAKRLYLQTFLKRVPAIRTQISTACTHIGTAATGLSYL
jgi:hypothetical protein